MQMNSMINHTRNQFEEGAHRILEEYKQSFDFTIAQSLISYLDGDLQEGSLKILKETTENMQPNNAEGFLDAYLPVYLTILDGPPQFSENSKQITRQLVLELLLKTLPSCNHSKYFDNILKTMLKIFECDNETNGISAAKTLVAVLKSLNVQPNQNADNSLKHLFEFLEKRSKSFSDFINDIVAHPDSHNPAFNPNPLGRIIKNSDSIKFINEIPNLYIYSLNLVDPANEVVKNSLKNSITNYIYALQKMPYTTLQKKAPRPYFTELIAIIVKLYNFLTMILKKQISTERLKDHCSNQNEHMMANGDAIAAGIMSFFIHLQEDFTPFRIELSGILKFSVRSLGAEKYKKYLNELLEEDVLFGKHKFKSIYGRNSIYSNWIDLMHALIPEFNLQQISKTFDILAKNIFDNSLYLSVHYSSLRLQQKIIEHHFRTRRSADGQENMQKIIIAKILQKMILKFKQIKEKVIEIDYFLNKKLPKNDNSTEKSQILLSNLPKKDDFTKESELDWMKKKIAYIEESKTNIDAYLFNDNLTNYSCIPIWEDEEELLTNSWNINHNTAGEFLRDIKELIIPALLESVKITVAFISNNYPIYSHMNMNMNMPPNRQIMKLSDEECTLLGKLLKYGLALIERLHNYKTHHEDKDKIATFFNIIISLDPKNIKDIFETNFKYLFDILIKFAKHCPENLCVQNILQSLLYSTNNWKYFAEIFSRKLIMKIESSPEELEPYHPYYEYKDEYHMLLQKLIKLPFRCLTKYEDDSFIEGTFKQIILIFFKKIHTSKYSIEYLLLLRNLFKNLMFYHKFDELFHKFQSICDSNLNVLKNFIALYETGIPELQDIISELILMLPLRTKSFIAFAKYLAASIVNSLDLSEPNFVLRAFKMLDIILTNYQDEDLDIFLDSVKDKLIQKLYKFLWTSQDHNTIINVAKLLGKLGHYPRTHKIKQTLSTAKLYEFQYQITVINNPEKFMMHINLLEPIKIAIQIVKQVSEDKGSSSQIKYSTIEAACNFLQTVLYKLVYKKIDIDDVKSNVANNWNIHQPNLGFKRSYELIADIIKTLINSTRNRKFKGIMRLIQLLLHCLEKYESMFLNLADTFALSYLACPDKEDQSNSLLVLTIISNLRHKIIYVRGDGKDPNFEFSLQIIDQFLQKIIAFYDKTPDFDVRIYNAIILKSLELFSKKDLIHTKGAAKLLIHLIGKLPHKYFLYHYLEIIHAIFLGIQKIPEVIKLSVFDDIKTLLQLLAEMQAEPITAKLPTTQHSTLVAVSELMVHQLISSNTNQNEAAKHFLTILSHSLSIKIPYLLFETEKQKSFSAAIKMDIEHRQLPYSRSTIIAENMPISKIISMMDKVFKEIPNMKNQKDMNQYLKLLKNSISTLIFLISDKILPFRFADEMENVLTLDFYAIIDTCFKIIEENDKIYKQNSYIIISMQPNQPPIHSDYGMGTPMGFYRNLSQSNAEGQDMEEEKKIEGQIPSQPQTHTNNQNYTINKMIFYDDDEFNINIEDIDLRIQLWSSLIASTLDLMQALMTHKSINSVIKSRQARKDGRIDRKTDEINEHRNKIIFKFFEMMLRIEHSIRRAASKGLKALIKLEQQAKDLLNEEKLKVILRPILICLQQEHQKFNIPFLSILRKLVKLLNQCFNKALSDKLIEHLNRFLEASVGRRSMQEPNVDEKKIASGILYLFEHLPHAGHSVDTIVRLSTRIDSCLVLVSGMSSHSQVIRQPLLKIVNTFASNANDFFLSNLQDFWKIYIYLLKADCSHPLRERLSRDTQTFLERTFLTEPTLHFDLNYKAIRIIRVVTKKNPRWLLNNRPIIDQIKKYWNSKDLRNAIEDEFCKDHIKDETSQLLKILILYCKNNTKEVQIIFDILPIFNIRTSNDYSFLHQFYRYYLPENYSSKEKRAIFLHFLDFLKKPDIPIDTKANASYILIYPMLLTSFQKGLAKEIFDNDLIERLSVIIAEYVNKKRPQEYGRLEMEILQICGLLMSYLKQDYMENDGEDRERKINLLKFGWNFMKNEDKIYSNIAKIFIAKFIYIYGVLPDQVIQLYMLLLKGQEYINSFDHDLKILSRKALDILIPYLPSIRQGEAQDGALPKWVGCTGKIFEQEGIVDLNNNLLVRFWQIFVRHHKVFAKYRNYFFTHMINCMQVLVYPSHTNTQSKKIAIDLALIHIEWQYQELREKLEKTQNLETKIKYLKEALTEECREIFMNFFIKMAMNNVQEKEEKENITKKALYLLKKCLLITSDPPIKYSIIDKILAPPNFYQRDGPDKVKLSYIILTILGILIENDKPDNIIANMDLILKIINHPTCTCLQCENPYLIQLVSNIVKRLLSLNHPPCITKIAQLIESGVKLYIQAYQARSGSAPVTDLTRNIPSISINACIRLAKALNDYKPDELEVFFHDFYEIAKIFTELLHKREFYNVQGAAKPYASKQGEEDLLANLDNAYTEEGFDSLKYHYANVREFVVILLRILSTKLPKFINSERNERNNMVDLYYVIIEKIPDPEINLEIVGILNSLLLSDYYDNVKSFIPPVKGSFSLNEKIAFFLDVRRVNSILEKSQDREIVQEKYATLIVDLMKCIPIKELEIERFRRLLIILSKYLNPEILDPLYEMVDNYYGGLFSKKFMFFMGDFSDENDLEDVEENEDIVSTICHFSLYSYSQKCRNDVNHTPLNLFNLAKDNKQQQNMIMEIEFPFDEQSLTSVKDTMNNLEGVDAISLINKMRKLLMIDFTSKPKLTSITLKELFRAVWSSVAAEEKNRIMQSIENYLVSNRINSVNSIAFLESIADLYPESKLKPEILAHVAKRSNAWWASAYQIEKCVDNTEDEDCENGIHGLHDIYGRLEDKDMIIGLKRLISSNPKIKKGLTLQQQRSWAKAGKLFASFIESTDLETESIYDVLNKKIAEESWIQIHKQLNDWKGLQTINDKHGDKVISQELNLEIAWKTKDLKVLEQNLMYLNQWNYNADSFLIQTFTRLTSALDAAQETNYAPSLKKVEEAVNGSAYCSIMEWNASPKYLTDFHKTILLRLQTLVEVEETLAMVGRIREKDLLDSPREHFAQQLFVVMGAWKSRLPHKSEDLSTWKTLLDHRNYMYALIKKRLHKVFYNPAQSISEQDLNKKLNYFNDNTWNNLKYCSIERKYGFYGNLKAFLNRLEYPDAIENPVEFYMSYKEQIMWRINNNSELDQALRLANKALENDNLHAEHKSEIHRLKVICYSQLGKIEDANNECFEAVKACETNWKSWHTWAQLCYKHYNNLKNQRSDVHYKWGEQTIICFLNAVKYKPHKSRLMISDIFILLSEDRLRNIVRAFEKVLEETPIWIWIIWIPQLLSVIIKPRNETNISYMLLKKLSLLYPQATYFSLRRLRAPSSQMPHGGFESAPPSGFINEILDTTKDKEPVLFEALESFVEFIYSLSNTQEEKMVNEMNNLILSLYQVDNHTQMEKFRLKIFLHLQTHSNIETINLTEIAKIQTASPLELLSILKNFVKRMRDKSKIMGNFEQKIDAIKHLKLVSLMNGIVDIPGQYYTIKEPQLDKNVKVVSLSREITSIEKSRCIHRSLTLLGSNEKEYLYIIQNKGSSSNSPTPVDTFTTMLNHQVKHIFNIYLSYDKETFSRGLKFTHTNEYYLNSQLALMEFKSDYKSFSDLLDEFMISKGFDGDLSLDCDVKDYLGNTGMLTSIFKKMDDLVPKTLLRNFILKNVQNYDEYFFIRKNFIHSYSIENFFSYIIANEMCLENMFINKRNGKFIYHNIKPNFIDSQKPNLNYSIRISKNFENFISLIGLEGPFASVFISSSIALSKPNYSIYTLLQLYIRESGIRFEIDDPQSRRIDHDVRLTENADEIMNRIKSFHYERGAEDEISEKIYNLIDEQLSPSYRRTVPLRFKNWF